MIDAANCRLNPVSGNPRRLTAPLAARARLRKSADRSAGAQTAISPRLLCRVTVLAQVDELGLDWRHGATAQGALGAARSCRREDRIVFLCGGEDGPPASCDCLIGCT